MTMEEIVQAEIEKNRAYSEFNKKIANEIWGWNK